MPAGVATQSSIGLNNGNNALVDVLSRQDKVSELIVKQQCSLLPVREITAFSGDPLQYQPFIKAFEHCIESKTDSNQDRLYFLERFTSGQAKDLVESCMYLEPSLGYREELWS